MNFDLTAAQRGRYDDVLAATRERLGQSPAAPEQHFTRERWQTAAEIGLTGLCLPAEYGGGGLGALDTALCLEAFGRGCPDTGLVFGVAAHLLACAVPVRDFATAEVRERVLAGMASGAVIAANAMTEPEAGSDVGRLGTVAQRKDGDFILYGEKSFASNAPMADVFVTYAVTDPAASFLGNSAFLVDRELAGVEVGPAFVKMGLGGCPAGRVRFNQCVVPATHLVGAEGQGGAVFQHSMGWERACLFAIYVGLMDEQLDRCVAHAGGRRQFGRRLGEFQAVSHRIAAMKQRLEAARLLLYRACWLLDEGRDHTLAAALSKVAVSEAAVANGLDAVQVFGGAGYLSETGIERQLRDAVPSAIFSGTNDIQREVIAREIGL
ncbi:acyl-CoA dehydrogenase family protein [Paractinoplanes durhamensis]|uniref:Acyl-CoA dehydrogenase n=1 Tax=Paractinoplanes durhamensis TaxID=113563 RepID=A0ABQ3ZD81_9ACTN|nr:acyl-CoA dehydrogenase family protein [Actinoplanes durhamensis]GIE07798.1 acyl-CoA dehydrogenase [Actinoplanes durhamensis]